MGTVDVSNGTIDVGKGTVGVSKGTVGVKKGSFRWSRGTGEFAGDRVGDVLRAARTQYGPTFASILDHSRVWLNGEAVESMNTSCARGDELAILPPVAGG